MCEYLKGKYGQLFGNKRITIRVGEVVWGKNPIEVILEQKSNMGLWNVRKN